MSDKMRWRYGDTNPVVAAVDSSVVIEIGDLIFMETDDARPASSLADQGLLADNQTAFAAKFLGVAMQRSRDGDVDPIRIATTGVFEYDCASATFELGDLVGPAGDDASLEDQEMVAVATKALAVGRVARRAATAGTSVLVDVRSTIMTGGVNGTTA